MRRPKRISRRELKAKIQELNYETQQLQMLLQASEARKSQLQEMYGRLLDRFTRLDNQIESFDSGSLIQMIEIEPIPVGQYAILADSFRIEEIPDVIKNQIVNNMVSQLLEHGYVKILTGCNLDKVTLGAKMYIVPWEQMARKRTVTAFVRSERNE